MNRLHRVKTKSSISIAVVAISATLAGAVSIAQENRTPNGILDQRASAYALTNLSVYRNGNYSAGQTLLIKDGLIEQVSDSAAIPAGYYELDLSGRFAYPGFIDVYSNYGIPELEEPEDSNGAGENLFSQAQAFNVNDAVRAHYRASEAFIPHEEERKKLRLQGFTAVSSFLADGIARGTSAVVTLGEENANEAIVMADASANFSFSKGSSNQSFPSSLMGSIALVRQTQLDAQWFEAQDPRPFTDESLEAFNRNRVLPQIMEVRNWQQALTADHIGDEFNTQYILKTSGDSYQSAGLIKDTNATLVVPVAYPEAPEVDDAYDSDDVPLNELRHWELAPYNLRVLHEAEVPFVITAAGSADDFLKNLRKAVANGLPEHVALNALTSGPAQLLGLSNMGSLDENMLANLFITSGPLFEQESRILQSWVNGHQYVLAEDQDERGGIYQLAIGDIEYLVAVNFDGGSPTMTLSAEDTIREDAATPSFELQTSDDLVTLNITIPATEDGDVAQSLRLNGWTIETGWRGNGQLTDGSWDDWQLTRISNETSASQSGQGSEQSIEEIPGAITFPFQAFGRDALPQQQDFVIRDAMVWTNEEAGNLITDVLVRDGKIAAIEAGVTAQGALEIEASGLHVTAGIIDEHSHIALFNINEGATNSSMVRMRDVVDSLNINIYRNLAGGVTAAQLLHGSANPIGGQSALIKMRWGQPAQNLWIEDADEFIKFALGENVKRSRSPSSVRYPQTRMGVEQVFVNAFSQAQEYEKEWQAYEDLSRTQRRNTTPPRRDLVDEAMLEVLNGERFVTSHSYVQSEINMLMHVADSFDFNINTFTHILEGYKVADKMAAHGAGGSTFSDWWGYKWEAYNAIPYNAALMHQAGVVTAINSDDAEMSRRLNQEAAKVIKYGGISEVEALKMVTLNPAKLLHLDDRMGSILVGKDADLVLWSDHPLSVYAIVETTWVDGIPYFDRDEDAMLRENIASERARLIAKILNSKSGE